MRFHFHAFRPMVLVAACALAPMLPILASPVLQTPSLLAKADELTNEVQAKLDAAFALGPQAIGIQTNDRALDALWFAALMKDGTSELLLAELSTISDEDDPDRKRVAMWLRASILVREGQAKDASDLLKDLGKLFEDNEPGEAATRFERARIADMRGKQVLARKGYTDLARDLQESGQHAELAQRLRLRLALLDEKKGVDAGRALSELAMEGDDETRRRAAVVLGLRGEAEAAFDLFPIPEGDLAVDTKRFRRQARLAEWALQAKDAVRAQNMAWNASRSAKLRRDRNYALTLAVEAYGLEDNLADLIARISALDESQVAAGHSLDDETLDVWIELLRESNRVDEAILLFEKRGAAMPQVKRSALIQLYREDGRTDEMIAALRREIAADQTNLAWRENLSRFFLERGNKADAVAVWSEFVTAESRSFGDEALLVGFHMLSDQGLDDLAVQVAERAITSADGRDRLAACLLLFGLHQERGDLEAAEADLERMAKFAAPEAPERLDLAEAWERLGRLDRAVEVLEGVVKVRGAAESGEDLAMHLAWLYSETGDEEQALIEWRALWLRVNAIARRRYVEDRMMTVAARLGSLADIAIDLETKLFNGQATEREAGLLVRLYTKVQDAVSATEVLDEFLSQDEAVALDSDEERKRRVAALEEKGRVYLACLDYFHFEETVRSLIATDPEGEPDYLRQLAMSQLERGRPDEARLSLGRLRDIEDDPSAGSSAEFEAGVLAIAGMRKEAIAAYRMGIAANPNRIESWLLLGNLMKEDGQGGRALAMYQQLAETAEADDLFMIAVDGLLNLEAPAATLKWARRATWERLAARSDRAYLYQLSADLSEAAEDTAGVLVALESSLSIAGERRGSILRELIDRTTASSDPFGASNEGDQDLQLAFSRRLLGLGEIVPPDVYLTLGESFLKADDAAGAERTFRKATDVPNQAGFRRQTAKLFEEQGFIDEALSVYEQVLSGDPNHAGLLIKVAELHERLGSDPLAFELYERAIELLISRMPLVSTKDDKRAVQSGARSYWGARNVDDFDRYFERAKLGFEASLDLVGLPDVVGHHIALVRAEFETDAADKIANAPRAMHRSRFARELALAAGKPELVADFDLWLLDTAFPEDEALLGRLLADRLDRGQVGSARALLDLTDRSKQETDPLRYRVGQSAEDGLPLRLEVEETLSLLVPLIIDGQNEEITLLLGRTNLTSLEGQNASRLGGLLNAAMFVGDASLSLRLGREWTRQLFEQGTSEWEIRPVLDRLETVLSPDDFRSLCMYLAEKALADPDKGQAVMSYLPSLAEKIGVKLFTTDQLFELLDARDDLGYGYGMESILLLFDENERASALRSMLPRINATARARFLIGLVTSRSADLGASLGDLIADSFSAAFGDANDSIKYYISNLGDLQKNQAVALAILDAILKTDPSHNDATAGKISLLNALDRKHEALDLARAAWPRLATVDSSDYYLSRARDTVREVLVENDLDAVLEEIAARLSDEPIKSATQRARLLNANERPEEGMQLLRDIFATSEGPMGTDYVLALEMLASHHGTEGRRLERLEVLEQVLEIHVREEAEDLEQRTRRSLVQGWKALRQPKRAVEFAHGLVVDEGSSEFDFVLPAGAIMIVNGQVVVGGETGDDDDQASIKRVQEASQEGRDEDAALLLRRLWRSFQVGITQDNRYGFLMNSMGSGTPVWNWPKQTEEDDEPENQPVAEQPLVLGGLLSYEEPKQADEAPKPINSYERLAQFNWGRREMAKILFTRSVSALDADGTRQLIAGLLAARNDTDPQVLRDELLDVLEGGLAGKAEHSMLLAFLDDHPELVNPRAEAALDELSRSLQTGDYGPLRALARLYAGRGDHAEAARIYRWLATKVAAINSWFGDEQVRIDARELFNEVREVLKAEPALLAEVCLEITFFATAGSDSWTRTAQDQFELEVWTKILPPAEALEYLREILGKISTTQFESGPSRGLARKAIAMYLQAGEIDRALVCLEVALCTFDAKLFQGEYIYPSPGLPGRLGNEDLASLFPQAQPDWPDPAGWYHAANAALVKWHAAGRIYAHTAGRAVALANLRLHEMEAGPGAALETLIHAALGQDSKRSERSFQQRGDTDQTRTQGPHFFTPSNMLYLIDAARMTDREGLARSLEIHLESTQGLPLGRVAPLVISTLNADGAAAAIALGEPYLEFLHASALLKAMASAYRENGQEPRALALEALAIEEQTAREELARLME